MPTRKENRQRSIVISKDIDDKIKQEAQISCCSENSVIRKCLAEYFNAKEKEYACLGLDEPTEN